MSLVFEAGSAGGALRIELTPPAGDAVAAALALAEHEALIVALEAWLQQPLDPRPLLPADAAHDGDADLLWAQCGAVRLGFAWPLLLNAASVPSASALPVEWPDLAFEIDVAEFSTDPQPADAQPADAVLLLPPAFEPTWRVLLHGVATPNQTTPAPPLWADAEWRGPGTALRLGGAPQPGPRRRAAWRVQLDTRYQRPLPELLGWVSPAEAEAAATAPRPSGASSPPRASGVPSSPRPGGDPSPPRFSGAAHLIAATRPAQPGCIAPALGGAGLWINS